MKSINKKFKLIFWMVITLLVCVGITPQGDIFSDLIFFLLFLGVFIFLPIMFILIFLQKQHPTIFNPPEVDVPLNSMAQNNVEVAEPVEYVKWTDFPELYATTDKELLESYIKDKLEEKNFDLKSKLLPLKVLKMRKILNIIFNILVFIYVSMIFFHFPTVTYIIGLVILIVFVLISRKFDLVKIIAKEIKSRPNEKMDNIILNEINNLKEDIPITYRICLTLVAIFLSLMIFMTPKIMYEKQNDGYAVRFYTYGLLNFKTVTIPEEHNGKKIVALRGNAFSNMNYLEKVILPDTIKEIRGQAFKNDRKLKEVNMPANLEYLGGGAFYNCTSLKSISLPDTLTYMGGETFYNAKSLKYVKLSENLTEIRGNTFENCTSLEEITIPDNVTRIGGHAFSGAYKLARVNLTANSKLSIIGSSAFRQCSNLKNIYIPIGTDVNSRAFKESPTVIKYFKEGR